MFTYQLNTNIGKVRLFCGDTDYVSHIFEDEELEVFLVRHDNSPELAAARALDTILTNRVLLAKRVKMGTYETEQFAANDMRQQIQSLRDAATTQNASTGKIVTTGEHLDSFDPAWLDENGDPVTT